VSARSADRRSLARISTGVALTGFPSLFLCSPVCGVVDRPYHYPPLSNVPLFSCSLLSTTNCSLYYVSFSSHYSASLLQSCYSADTNIILPLINTMYYDQQDAGASTLLHPLNIDVTLGQTDAPSHTSPRSHANGNDLHRHRDGDQGVDTFQVSVPGGASILMKDSAGSSMSLNLGIDPSSGTPILSGRAIDAHGGILDVHPCSCSDPISPRHKLPGTPDHFRGGTHLRDHTHLHSASKSPFGAHRRLVSTPTPLIVVQPVQTSLVHSPSRPEPQSVEAEAPVPETSVDVLKSPFTPTPSMQRRPSSPDSDRSETFHTPPLGPENPSNPCQTVPVPESSSNSPLPARAALNLNYIPEESIFESDTPLVQSPTADSERSGPSALGPIPSIPSSPSHPASERSTQTVMPHSHHVHAVQLHLPEQPNTESPAIEPLWHDSAVPGPSVGFVHPASFDTRGHDGLTSIADAHTTNPQATVIDLDSDLYTDRPADPLPSMPVARIGSDGEELRYNLEAQPRFNPTEVCIRLLNIVT
jgi:hypothetical protein